jgi:hypothetical protein
MQFLTPAQSPVADQIWLLFTEHQYTTIFSWVNRQPLFFMTRHKSAKTVNPISSSSER